MAVFRLPPVAQFQQPRVYADARSTDAPIPQTLEALSQIVWLRRRADYELEQQQPRRLLDTSLTASVDAPIPKSVLVTPTCRPAARYPTQLRNLSPDLLAPLVTPDNPTGAPFTQWASRAPSWEQWLQAERLHPDTLASVDAPIPAAFPVELTNRTRWPYPTSHGLPVDILAPAVTPDPPPGVPAQQVAYLRAVSSAYWQDRPLLDTSLTASVDSPPGFLIQPPARRDVNLTQWHQSAPGFISGPDNPAAPTQQAATYLRALAEWQAWQKAPSVLFLITVDAPPTRGPFQSAPYRRPVPPTPYRLPSTSVLVAPPVLPAPVINYPTTTTAVVDGRVSSTVVLDGASSSSPLADGRNRSDQP